MIVVDANLLIYAHNTLDERFEPARRWLQRAFSGTERIGLPWSVIHAFLRITTATRALPAAFTIDEATFIVDEWLGLPAVRVIEPGARYWPIFRELV
ncbi:MAG: type II toxin-antitoxin system VapC family toxin, partial [Thermoanaerobaculia bacterium]